MVAREDESLRHKEIMFGKGERTRVLNVAHNVLCFAIAHGVGFNDGESALHSLNNAPANQKCVT